MSLVACCTKEDVGLMADLPNHREAIPNMCYSIHDVRLPMRSAEDNTSPRVVIMPIGLLLLLLLPLEHSIGPEDDGPWPPRISSHESFR